MCSVNQYCLVITDSRIPANIKYLCLLSIILSIRVLLSESLVGRVIDGKYPELRIH